MKLVIEIPEEDYIRLRDEGMFGNVTTFKRAVREGIPLEEPCTDAISRQAVLNYIRDNYRRWFINDDAFVQCMNGIKDIVPVTPAEKVGQWIDIQYFKSDDTYYRPKCPFCNTEPKEYSNYCPNCGAKMASPTGAESEG